MDFVSDSLSTGRRIKCLTVVDAFSHECGSIAVDRASRANTSRVCSTGRWSFRGLPLALRTNSNPEFTGRAFMGWAQIHGIRRILIEPRRTATSSASTASSETSARTNSDSRRCCRPDRQAAQQLPANAIGEVRRAASPSRWRCSSTQLNNH
ncbi:DDE-type integrase/transposase/recombinase [Variovorax sp. SG517]|uniref:integrase catalytic domain-containing protein n=1 Tax=Variovorax sp. SG517 TaxID=2587117 RepID=UPI00159E550F